MGQGKLEIFLENTSGMELAEVSAAPVEISERKRGLRSGASSWYKSTEFRPWAQTQFLLLGKGLLSHSGTPGAVSAPRSLRCWDPAPLTWHRGPPHLQEVRVLGPCPLPLVVWTRHTGAHVSFTVAPWRHLRCAERLASVPREAQTQLLPPQAGRPARLKHRRVKLPLETSHLFQTHPSLQC